MSQKTKRLTVNLIAQVISFAVSMGISFFLTPYVTAKLGKDVYGFVGMAYQITSYISLFTVAFNAMLNIFVATEYHKNEIEKANGYYSSVMFADVILSVILMLPMFLVVVFMENFLDVPAASLNDIKALWAFIFLTFLIQLATGPLGVGFFVSNRLDISAKRGITSNLIKGVILVSTFACLVPKVWYVGFATFLCNMYIVVANLKYKNELTPEIRFSRKHISFKAIKELISVGIWNTINQLTNILLNGLDLIVTNMFINALAMGYISYAQTFPIQINNLLGTISGSFTPDLTKCYAQGDMEIFKKEVNSAVKICGFLCSIPLLGFMVFGTSFYILWLPTLTADEVKTINILSWLILVPTFFTVYTYPLSSVQSITKKIKLPVIVSLVVSIINIVMELLLLKYTDLGVYAIEIATALVLGLKVIVFTPMYAAHNLGKRWYVFYPNIIRGVISSLVILGVFYLIKINTDTSSWIKLILVGVVAGGLGYAINFVTLLNKTERTKVVNKIKSKLHK